jgi:ribonuclease-3
VQDRAQSYERLAFLGDSVLSLSVSTHIFPRYPEFGVGKNAEVLVGSDRILASVCEAIIGAAYLTFGFERVAPAIVDAFADQVEDALANPVDFKSLLQEHLARRSQLVVYRIDEETGPPHDRSFLAVAEVSGEEIGRGAGKTKKSAEQEAASAALERFGEDA